jgi:alpha-D-ribose 1-methylphosphonate 5-triphosphate synthase subunit PhnH
MNILEPGFSTPLEAQACFRGVLQALSTPGVQIPLPARLTPPAPLSPAAAAILLTLVDPMVTASLPDGPAARDWLVFHTGSRLVEAGEGDFVYATTRPALVTLRQGSDGAPEDSTTLILDVPELDAGPLCRLTGPGIETEILTRLPLDENFLAEWRAQSRNAPRGVDIILCAGTTIIGLPRSLTIGDA